MNTLNKRSPFVRSPFLRLVAMVILTLSPSPAFSKGLDEAKSFRAGVASVDVSPVKLPVISSGGFAHFEGRVADAAIFRGESK